MKILFLSLSRFDDVNVRGIYSDLMREFIKRGNDVYIASPTERRFGKKTHIIESNNCHILKIRTLNIQKTNIIEKGVGTLLLESQFNRAVRKYWGDVNFDLVLYATPPITFNKVIERVKKRCGCRSYLMLKDIFPQNAVDLGMMKEDSLIHRLFRKKEKRLYEISDKIGCMSQANCRYVIDHNPGVDAAKIELCPNAIELTEQTPIDTDERKALLSKYDIPSDKTLFIYGGNLGKPQGLDFLLKVIEANENRENSHIVVVGSGTEYPKIKTWFDTNKPSNSTLLSALPKEDYDNLVRACDVGLIFLDPRFTIPNFPSRLLSYLENSMPVLLATDVNTDQGRIAEENGFGLWCENGDLKTFMANMTKLTSNSEVCRNMGNVGKKYLIDNYTINKIADIIVKSMIRTPMTTKDIILRETTGDGLKKRLPFAHFGWEGGGAFSFYIVSDGYWNAARTILEKMVTNYNDFAIVDSLIYPLLFNYRHSIETFLKHLYFCFGEQSDEARKAYLNIGHDLRNLWMTLKPFLQKGKKHVGTSVDLDAVEHYILEVNDFDPDSMLMRYPIEKDLSKNKSHEYRLDYVHFSKRMNDLCNALRQLSYELSNQMDSVASWEELNSYLSIYEKHRQDVKKFLEILAYESVNENEKQQDIIKDIFERQPSQIITFLMSCEPDLLILLDNLFYAGRTVNSEEARLSKSPAQRQSEFIKLCYELLEHDGLKFGVKPNDSQINIYGKQASALLAAIQTSESILDFGLPEDA